MLPFAVGGVTETLGLGRREEGEGPTDSSEVWGFPGSLAHALGEDWVGPAGLWMDGGRAEKRKGET